MKIWIDVTNSPHVCFFADLINELNGEHEVLITCRPLANTIELLQMKGLAYHVVGRHYGTSNLMKAMGFCARIWQLFTFLRDKNINVAISHSSFYSPVVAGLLGVRSIYLNDNEHAAGNRISFLFANKIMVPEYLHMDEIRRQWARREKITSYPGVKEAVYLWGYKRPGQSKQSERTAKQIFIRPEPWTAQYYRGKKNFIDKLLLDLKDDFKIVLLPRGQKQKQYYQHRKFSGIVIPETSMPLTEIVENCDLFIGAGGTMTREAALLGVATISIYQDKLLEVDRYLIKKQCMTHKPDIDAEFVKQFIQTNRRRAPDQALLVKGREAYRLIKRTLLEIGNCLETI